MWFIFRVNNTGLVLLSILSRKWRNPGSQEDSDCACAETTGFGGWWIWQERGVWSNHRVCVNTGVDISCITGILLDYVIMQAMYLFVCFHSAYFICFQWPLVRAPKNAWSLWQIVTYCIGRARTEPEWLLVYWLNCRNGFQKWTCIIIMYISPPCVLW